MKDLKRLFGSREEQLVTVCWMDEEVTMVQWTEGGDGSWNFKDALLLEARGFTAHTYRDGLNRLTSGAGSESCRVRWIILKESFPYPVEREKGKAASPVRLPGWIERSWYALNVEELPDQIICGMTALEQELVNWRGFEREGTGLCLVVGSRLLFIGHGNRTPFRRLSRRHLIRPESDDRILSDWLLQTRLLFRNRTGMELRRVYDPEGRASSSTVSREPSFEMIPGQCPDAWTCSGKSVVGDGMIHLHLSSASFRKGGPGILRFPQVYRRLRYREWENRLRVAACILICVWGLLFLGACRSSGTSSQAGKGSYQEWEQAKKRLEKFQADWSSREGSDSRADLPFEWVGTLAQSVPEGIKVHRIHLTREGKSGGGHLKLALEGIYQGDHPSGVFRGWMDELHENKTFSRVENLRFHREEDAVVFSLQGLSQRVGVTP